MTMCPNCDRLVPASHFYCRTGTPRCRGKQTWDRARRYRLLVLVDEGHSDAEIARRMDTTATAVKLARKRYGIRSCYRRVLSARAVGRVMGTHEKAARTWIERGFLRGRRARVMGPHAGWYVERDALYAFVENEATWHLWTPERITDRMLRRYAEQVRGDVRFLSASEVAARCYVQPGTVSQWIRKGWLPARRWGNWWVDERDLERFDPPGIGNRYRAA